MIGHHKLIVGIALTTLLAGCGGGSNNGTSAPATAADTQQISSGTITGFGSVHVNGEHWETDQASFEIDDEIGSETDLEVGHVVVVRGTVAADGTATADSIEYDAELEGPISAVDLAAGTITVLGYVGVINNDTVFDDDSGVTAIEDLMVGDFVEINGYPMADGTLLIVHLEKETDEGEVEIAGTITNLDSMANTFNLGAQVIDYSGAVLEDFDGQAIANDQYVEVEGSSTLGPNGEVVADKVELEGEDYDGDEFEVEGLITAVNSDGSIVVAGITIAVGAGVEYEHGTASDVVIDARVEVEGTVNGPGSYSATEIEFDYESTLEVEAPVQAVDTTEGTITVLGIVFRTLPTTRYEDDSATSAMPFDLSNISEGDWVSIDAYTDGTTGNQVANSIEREDTDELVEIDGPIDSVDGGQIMMLGITINTDVNTEVDGGSVAGLQEGMFIEVAGLQTGDAEVAAIEIEIDD